MNLTAEEFFRNKLKEKGVPEPITLSRSLMTAEEGVRWAHEFKELHVNKPSSDNLFYIQNTAAGYIGNAIVFWGKNNVGYYADLKNCQRYTEEEARKICLNNPDKNKAWPCSYIDNPKNVQIVTNSQFLDPDQIKTFI